MYFLWMNKVPAFHPSQRPKGSHPQPKFVCESVCWFVCARNTFFLSLFLSFFLSAEPVGARNFVVLLSTNFRSRHRERHQVSVYLCHSSPFHGCILGLAKGWFQNSYGALRGSEIRVSEFLWWSCVMMSKALSLSLPLCPGLFFLSSLSRRECCRSFCVRRPSGRIKQCAKVSVFLREAGFVYSHLRGFCFA